MRLIGLWMFAVGIVYILKPDIFRRGLWTKTSLAQRSLNPGNYVLYMRLLGVVSILIGLWLIVFGRWR